MTDPSAPARSFDGANEEEAATSDDTATFVPKPTVAKPDEESAAAVPRRPWLRRYLTLVAVMVLLVVVAVVLGTCLGLVLPKKRGNQSSNTAVVNLNYSSYAGVQLPGGVNQFLGMRYAAAPLGDLRWRAPVEPPQTSGAQQADQFGPICLGIGAGYPAPGQDEDCLFANVWAPANVTAQSKLPVWVFIQGGGYTVNANANWNGSELVEKSGYNIVFVNFNYRVGMWGFMASSEVQQAGDLNVGMLDQRMLLTWVKNNIAQFGGDPDHVVIHGASAGAGSVALHLVAYGGRNDNLFVGGVAESIFFPSQPYLSELEWQYERVMQQSGCNSTTDPTQIMADPNQQMTCLRNMDVAALQAINIAQEFPGRSDPPLPLFYWTPCIDGDFLQDLPYNLYEQGHFINVPILYGTTTNEGSVFVNNAATSADMATFFENNYFKLSDNDTDSIIEQYPIMAALPEHNAWFPSVSAAYGESTFICPAVNTLNAVQAGSAPANNTATNTTTSSSTNSSSSLSAPSLFSYRYNVQDDQNTASGFDVVHLFESAAVFGPDNIGGPAAASYYTYNAAIVPIVMAYFTSFVRALDPNPFRALGAPVWEAWGDNGGMRRLVLQTNASTMETTPTDQVGRCAFWLGLGATMDVK